MGDSYYEAYFDVRESSLEIEVNELASGDVQVLIQDKDNSLQIVLTKEQASTLQKSLYSLMRRSR